MPVIWRRGISSPEAELSAEAAGVVATWSVLSTYFRFRADYCGTVMVPSVISAINFAASVLTEAESM